MMEGMKISWLPSSAGQIADFKESFWKLEKLYKIRLNDKLSFEKDWNYRNYPVLLSLREADQYQRS